ncbi:hypothetical protein TrRE_jg3937, partial [Triparma retinervis]
MDKALLIPVPCNVKMHNNDPRGRIIEIHKGFHLPEGSGNVGEAVLTASCFAGVNEDEKELGSASLLVKCCQKEDTHKRGYIEIHISLLSSSLPVRGFLESGLFEMNIVDSDGIFLPDGCGPYLDPRNVSVNFETLRQPFQSVESKKKVTKLKYFDSRSTSIGGPEVPILRFRVECITTKLGLRDDQFTSGCRLKLWGTGPYSGLSALTPSFIIKSKNPKYKYQCAQ